MSQGKPEGYRLRYRGGIRGKATGSGVRLRDQGQGKATLQGKGKATGEAADQATGKGKPSGIDQGKGKGQSKAV